MLKKLLFVLILLIPTRAFADVEIWESTFEDTWAVAVDGSFYLRADNPNLEGVRVVRIYSNVTAQDFYINEGTLNLLMTHIELDEIRFRTQKRTPLISLSRPTQISLDLNGPAWKTIWIRESTANGILNTFYKKVFDTADKKWRWEVVLQKIY